MKKEIIKKFLNSWKQGVIDIGKAYKEDRDFKKLAEIKQIKQKKNRNYRNSH